MEDEAVHADGLVVRHAEPLNQALLVAQGAQRRHEPAVAVAALPHVVCGRPLDVELRLVEDLGDALGAAGAKVAAGGLAGAADVAERLEVHLVSGARSAHEGVEPPLLS